MIKYFRFFLLSLGCLLAYDSPLAAWTAQEIQGVASSADQSSSSWEEVVDYANEHLPLEGELKAKVDGFVYIKVDDEYIHTLFPMLDLEEEGYKKPPYFRTKEASGAHISVFYENENVIPEEIGQTFHFELKRIVIVQPAKGTYYAVLQVESPELEQLRMKYGKKPKLHGHEFHISLAKKKSSSKK